MSAIAFLQQLLDAGIPIDVALKAAEVYEKHPDAFPRRSPPRPDPNEKVWVYVFAVDHPDDFLVKVGISKHPNYRMLTLEKERGFNLYVAHTEGPFTRQGAVAVERRAHEVLAAQRETGEWFLCGADRAIEVVQACASKGEQ